MPINKRLVMDFGKKKIKSFRFCGNYKVNYMYNMSI